MPCCCWSTLPLCQQLGTVARLNSSQLADKSPETLERSAHQRLRDRFRTVASILLGSAPDLQTYSTTCTDVNSQPPSTHTVGMD
ncbi:unnamed protein product [Vitrella brassicaformis CCMP3155]|uniref:Uncharacterized protein n=1 Tax=Vitrella brassicaformis (strain CCMP3155) TaxID=1169540 RepID=A0A0G4GSV4_VITBC|nr:unnamed protein product [Vitrella brassicaformis CCMP3155]|eukprot:CEM33761.1 unnamed protein product [Vitrella brassicaformis CCMP3155]